jgi:arylsulfatase A-like enzyme
MTKKPNILFFFTDDQRFNTIRALGNPQIHTPNMDRLVAQGTAFARAHIMGGTSPAVCMPSRAMLHTGRTLFSIQDQGETISPDHVLLGEALQQNGYTTHGIGKWHNGKESFNRAFSGGDEIYFGGMCDHWNVPAYHYDPTGAYSNQIPVCKDPWTTNELEWREADHIEPGRHSSELLCDGAVRFLNQYQSDDPFFLYVSFLAPHDPRTMPEEYQKMYDSETIELPPNFMGAHPFDNGELKIRDELLEEWPRTPEAIRRHIAEYCGMITHADAEIGRVISALERRGDLDNTIIVFAGDNGLALGQHGLMGKQNLYDHSVRVPLILAGPGIPAGKHSDSLCYLIDIYPTLCDLTGIPVPETVEGKSLVPAMNGTSVRDHLMLAYCHQMRGVRDDRFKLIETVVDGCRTTQLFDLEEDPWELHNLAEDPAHTEIRKALGALLDTWRTDHGDTRSQGRIFWSGYDQTQICRKDSK